MTAICGVCAPGSCVAWCMTLMCADAYLLVRRPPRADRELSSVKTERGCAGRSDLSSFFTGRTQGEP